MQKLISVAFVLSALVHTGCASQTAAKADTSTVAEVKKPAPAFEEVEVSGPDGTPLYFAFDEDLLDDSARKKLRSIAGHLKKDPTLYVTIEGHCDDTGTSEYNLALGERRAAAARMYLVALGVKEPRVRAVSFGEEMPAIDGADDVARAQNRRDEFVFLRSTDEDQRADLLRASVDWDG